MSLFAIFKNQFLKLGEIFLGQIWVELVNCPKASQLKLAGAVRERPPATPPLNNSRNRFTANIRILTTNESNSHNYLFNKFLSRQNSRKLNLMHFIYLVSVKKKPTQNVQKRWKSEFGLKIIFRSKSQFDLKKFFGQNLSLSWKSFSDKNLSLTWKNFSTKKNFPKKIFGRNLSLSWK